MDDIPENVKRFIATNIESIYQLRILLLLQGSPDQDWTSDVVGAKLYLDRALAGTQLAILASRGFFSTQPGSNPTYRYEPATPALREMAACLAQLDRERPVTLINLVYSGQKNAAQSFANAFRFKQDQ